MGLSIQQYNEIISIGLDLQLAQVRGGLVFDGRDVALESDNIFRNRLKKLVARKDIDKLERMLQQLMHSFRFKDRFGFASILAQKTGYNLVPIAQEHISIPYVRNLRVCFSGKGENSLTFVTIELSTGSGSIYCIKDHHSEVKANWLDNETVEILVPSRRDEMLRVHEVRSYEECINVTYREF